ncbi:hypothetical protein KL919_003223 [Ogataea angusta]|nr:hypothetical protein KL919_003223 [Ogataea angusta]
MPKRFFDESDEETKSSEDSRLNSLTVPAQNFNEKACGISSSCPGNAQYLDTQESHEPQFRHYHQSVCSVCHALLENSHVLELHLNELHSSFFKSRLDKGALVFECLNGHCSEVFSTVEGRKQHMISCHDYPQDFDFTALLLGHPPTSRNC